MKQPRRVLSPALLELARRAGDGEVSPGFARAAKDKLQATLERPKPSLVRTFAPLAAAAFVMAILLLGYDSQRVRFDVSGAGEVTPGGYVHARASEHPRIVFSEGSFVDVDPNSTVRVGSAGLRGAELVQESGRATYSIVHRPATAWSVKAGPFRVLVTGTRFSIEWLPEPGEVVVELHEGTVTVEGPTLAGAVSLDAGERFKASARGNVVVEALEKRPTDPSTDPSDPISIPTDRNPTSGDPSSAPTDGSSTSGDRSSGPTDGSSISGDRSSTPTGRSSTSGGPSTVAAGGAGGSSSSPPLADQLARGQSSQIVADVERIGISSFAATASAADLAIVADAARFARKPALANAALLALRQRHPGTREAVLAAFHLARAADATNPTAAIGWYDTYLAEAGGAGVFILEARGRKMVAVQRTQGDSAARPLAEAYLAAYPKGPHARQAHAILGDSAAVP